MAQRPAFRPTLQARGEGGGERFVALATDDGTIVYPVTNPRDTNTVMGSPDNPDCTCEAFRSGNQAGSPCIHIETVFGRMEPDPEPPPAAPARALRAVPSPVPTAANSIEPAAESPPPMMLLKRSVSPDGRIDSLSVELSHPIGALKESEIKSKAQAGLSLQGQIADEFLRAAKPAPAAPRPKAMVQATPPPSPPQQRRPTESIPDGAMNGTITYIGRTKSGNSFSLSVESQGERYRYFGNRRSIIETLNNLGAEVSQDELWHGAKLSVPCLFTVKPSRDGQYTNVDQIYPAGSRP